jgi:uncharacterized protein
MSRVFIDTSYLLALELRNDQNHGEATAHWRRAAPALPLLVTTTYVFDEVVTFFSSRGAHAKATQIGYALMHSPSVQLVQVNETLFRDAWAYFQKHSDKMYSFTDCVSFVLSHKLAITTAFAFDKHFAQAGLSVEP